MGIGKLTAASGLFLSVHEIQGFYIFSVVKTKEDGTETIWPAKPKAFTYYLAPHRRGLLPLLLALITFRVSLESSQDYTE